MKLKYYIQTGVVALAAATVGVSCTDTWDDHYSVNGTVPGATPVSYTHLTLPTIRLV